MHEVDVTRWLLGEEIVRATVLTPTPTAAARPGLRDPQLSLFETESGRLVDVEAFVSAGYAYDIRCEVVGEAGRSSCCRPRPSRCAAGTGVAPDPAGLPAALRRRLSSRAAGVGRRDRGSARSRPAPRAWDGYAAAAVCEAAVASLESGRPVDVHPLNSSPK